MFELRETKHAGKAMLQSAKLIPGLIYNKKCYDPYFMTYDLHPFLMILFTELIFSGKCISLDLLL